MKTYSLPVFVEHFKDICSFIINLLAIVLHCHENNYGKFVAVQNRRETVKIEKKYMHKNATRFRLTVDNTIR